MINFWFFFWVTCKQTVWTIFIKFEKMMKLFLICKEKLAYVKKLIYVYLWVHNSSLMIYFAIHNIANHTNWIAWVLLEFTANQRLDLLLSNLFRMFSGRWRIKLYTSENVVPSSCVGWMRDFAINEVAHHSNRFTLVFFRVHSKRTVWPIFIQLVKLTKLF